MFTFEFSPKQGEEVCETILSCPQEKVLLNEIESINQYIKSINY